MKHRIIYFLFLFCLNINSFAQTWDELLSTYKANLLTNSVKRTQLIFDELRNSKNTSASTNIQTCLNEIIKEKQLIWRNECEIRYNETQLKNKIIMAQASELKRIISNVLNNEGSSADLKHSVINIGLVYLFGANK